MAMDASTEGATSNIERFVAREWEQILAAWGRGWAADERLASLEHYIEVTRKEIFEAEPRRSDAEQADWLRAHSIHLTNVDFVRNRRKHIDDLRVLWSEWEGRNHIYMSAVAIEALRSMVIVNGAAIIAALAVISGQISNPPASAVMVAKITIFTSVISLILMGSGQALLVETIGEVGSRVRGVLVGNLRHRRLFAINRYLRRYLDRKVMWGTILIYLSIVVFGFSALISSLILMAL